MLLDTYLNHAMAKPWAWGELDCVHFAGDWIRERTGLDPLAPYREAYDSALGARRLVAQRGGLLAMVGAEMDRCGFTRVEAPDHGDIGVVAQPGISKHSVARAAVVIFNGRWWIARMLDGIASTQDQPLAIWKVAG